MRKFVLSKRKFTVEDKTKGKSYPLHDQVIVACQRLDFRIKLTHSVIQPLKTCASSERTRKVVENNRRLFPVEHSKSLAARTLKRVEFSSCFRIALKGVCQVDFLVHQIECVKRRRKTIF